MPADVSPTTSPADIRAQEVEPFDHSNTMGLESPVSPSLEGSTEKKIYEEEKDTVNVGDEESSSIKAETGASGILTPPIEEPESDPQEENAISLQDNEAQSKRNGGKPGGRLKFYKDGIMCLELSHDCGEKSKWVQIKCKTVVPKIVVAKKEANIPHPPGLASSLVSAGMSRVESSTSQSMSDDGSSIMSSPRVPRDTSSLKQSVPRRGLSHKLEFYLKVSPCVVKCRNKIVYCKRKPHEALEAPSNICDTLSCSCSSSNANQNNAKPRAKFEKIEEAKRQERIEKLVESLMSFKLNETNKCTKFNVGARDFDVDKSSISPPVKFSLTPKKRAYKEGSDVRPKLKRMSPKYSQEKTILNVPELISRQRLMNCDSNNSTSNSSGSPVISNNSYCNNSSKNPNNNPEHDSLSLIEGRKMPIKKWKHKSPCSSPSAKCSPADSELNEPNKKLISQLNHGLFNSNAIVNFQGLGYLTKEEHQQTVSNAISYTINSLLGDGTENCTQDSKSVSARKKNKTPPYPSSNPQKEAKNVETTNKIHRGNVPTEVIRKREGDQNQNSFLRHLLDTSDPIPNVSTPSPSHNSTSSPSPCAISSDRSNRYSNVSVNNSQCDRRHLGHNSHKHQAPIMKETSKHPSGRGSSSSRNNKVHSSIDRDSVPSADWAAEAINHYRSALGMFPNLNSAAAAVVSYLGMNSLSAPAPSNLTRYNPSSQIGVSPGFLGGAWSSPNGIRAPNSTEPFLITQENGASSSANVKNGGPTPAAHSSFSHYQRRNDFKGHREERSITEGSSCPYDLSIRGPNRPASNLVSSLPSLGDDSPLDLCKKPKTRT